MWSPIDFYTHRSISLWVNKFIDVVTHRLLYTSKYQSMGKHTHRLLYTSKYQSMGKQVYRCGHPQTSIHIEVLVYGSTSLQMWSPQTSIHIEVLVYGSTSLQMWSPIDFYTHRSISLWVNKFIDVVTHRLLYTSKYQSMGQQVVYGSNKFIDVVTHRLLYTSKYQSMGKQVYRCGHPQTSIHIEVLVYGSTSLQMWSHIDFYTHRSISLWVNKFIDVVTHRLLYTSKYQSMGKQVYRCGHPQTSIHIEVLVYG